MVERKVRKVELEERGERKSRKVEVIERMRRKGRKEWWEGMKGGK